MSAQEVLLDGDGRILEEEEKDRRNRRSGLSRTAVKKNTKNPPK